jgi:hypothetical protein
MTVQQQEKAMLRVLITQKNEDGSVKVVNGVEQHGGVVYDRLGEALGYVYDESKYDRGYKRKKEHYVKDWYSK